MVNLLLKYKLSSKLKVQIFKFCLVLFRGQTFQNFKELHQLKVIKTMVVFYSTGNGAADWNFPQFRATTRKLYQIRDLTMKQLPQNAQVGRVLF